MTSAFKKKRDLVGILGDHIIMTDWYDYHLFINFVQESTLMSHTFYNNGVIV